MGLLPSTMVMMSSVAVTSLSLSVAMRAGVWAKSTTSSPTTRWATGRVSSSSNRRASAHRRSWLTGNHLGRAFRMSNFDLVDETLAACPAQEAGQLFPLAGEGKQVVVEKNLVESGECLVLLVKPVEKPIGGTQGTGGVVPLRRGAATGAAGGPGSSQQLPADAAAKEPAALGVRDGVEEPMKLVFEPGELGVSVREDTKSGEEMLEIVGRAGWSGRGRRADRGPMTAPRWQAGRAAWPLAGWNGASQVWDSGRSVTTRAANNSSSPRACRLAWSPRSVSSRATSTQRAQRPR